MAGLERAGPVTEYDRSGRIVWRATRPGTIYEAQRLHGGNTLIATSKGVSELDISGRVIWNKDVGPCRVMRY